jgi:hypothetical protein
MGLSKIGGKSESPLGLFSRAFEVATKEERHAQTNASFRIGRVQRDRAARQLIGATLYLCKGCRC